MEFPFTGLLSWAFNVSGMVTIFLAIDESSLVVNLISCISHDILTSRPAPSDSYVRIAVGHRGITGSREDDSTGPAGHL